MPFKFEIDKLHIASKDDRRIKLTPEEREEIQYRYKVIGGVSYNDLAKEYEVSKSLIIYVVNPERREKNYRLRQARGGSKQYYDKDKNTETMREHRQYKKSLNDEGKLEK